MPTADVLVESARVAIDTDTSQRIVRAIATVGSTVESCLEYVRQVTEVPATQRPLAEVKAAIVAAGLDPDRAFERFLLTSVARESLDKLDAMPVTGDVKSLCRKAFARFADPQQGYDVGTSNFGAYCKIASLRRFPAGQFDWERSGLPRSWIPKIRPLRTLRATMGFAAFQMRGFGPLFFFHMGTGGRNYALIEREAQRSYHRMARSLELQPDVHGVMTASWLFSPDTFAISPHLAWLNRTFQENGALLATIGADDPSSGVLHRSPERRRAYEAGTWKPTIGLVIWPRGEMLAWARRHPELES
jgi:hypothetical protein